MSFLFGTSREAAGEATKPRSRQCVNFLKLTLPNISKNSKPISKGELPQENVLLYFQSIVIMGKMAKSGIYKIVNRTNGKYYVGSTTNFLERWRYHHRRKLRGNFHPNQKLQNAWNKYGETAFEIVEIEEIPPVREELVKAEQVHLAIAEQNQDGCYNLAFDALGGTPTPETREKIRQKALLRPPITEATRAKLKQRRHTEESKQHLREINSGEKASFFGRHHSAEQKEKWSIMAKARMANPYANPRFDHAVYLFNNMFTAEQFSGTQYDFIKTCGVPRPMVSDLVNGKTKQSKTGWRLYGVLKSQKPFLDKGYEL